MGDGSRRRGLFSRRTPAPHEHSDGLDTPADEHEVELADLLDAFSAPSTRSADEIRAAFGHRQPRTIPQDPEPESFSTRYSTDSLFLTAEDDAVVDPEDPWYVLGLEPGSDWHSIVAAHRSLARVHHPDHLADASPEDRARAERRMREINVAYTTLRHALQS